MRFLSINHLISNRQKISAALKVNSSEDEDLAYRLAVGKMRGFPAPGSGIRISFEDEPPAQFIQSSGSFDDIFAHVRPSSSVERDEVRKAIPKAISFMDSLDPLLADIVRLTVTDVIVMPADRVGGGSGSHFPGLLCVSPGPDWSKSDVAETLLHEAAHLNAFICEMLHPFYRKSLAKLAEPSNRVVSAVRIGELRPLDKALHSALVAVPLMYLQHLIGATTLIDLFSESIKECADGLRQKRECFTPYGWAVVNELAEFADSIDFALVASGLRRPDESCLIP